MKKIVRLVLLAVILVSMATVMIMCFSTSGKDNKKDSSTAKVNAPTQSEETTKDDEDILLSGKQHVSVEIANYGTLELELDADVAPITVTNFVKLAEQGFYDGLTFHRIITGFMIQGGDPNGDGTGGSEETIKGEFTSNGIDNNLSHKRGVISMARSTDPDSASSQFFICHQDSTFLDGEYAAFGTVTAGMEIVDKICEDATPLDNNGTIAKDKQPKITAVRVIE